MKRFFTLSMLLLASIGAINAAKVKVVMNAVSTTMSLTDKATGDTIAVGEPDSKTYSFDANAGTYVLTAYGTDGATVNGTIELNVTNDEEEQTFTVLTCTAYLTNKNSDNTAWVLGTDFTVDVNVYSKYGEKQIQTAGNSVTANRATFLAFNGNSYYLTFVPSAAQTEEGYMPLYKSATLTANVNVSGVVTKGEDYSIVIPQDAQLVLGRKFAHFTEFETIAPVSTETVDGGKKLTYHLAYSQVYNYRTWKEGGLTYGGYFTMNATAEKRPTLGFSDSDYSKESAKTINHDVTSNKGYETGDILVNINERGHLSMNVGETFEAHAMRSWQLTDNSTNNYFIEPDFHYTVIDVNGNPSTGVIEIDNADTTTSPWSTIKAVGKGTAIVLVTYDAIDLNYYNASTGVKTEYLGGEFWGAIWPENTAAYVVTVGESEGSIVPNMFINQAYNESAKKVAGNYVDAEHDVFYYLDTTNGANYTFKPEGVDKVEIAYPTIGTQMATYKGFGSEGVTKNEDGSYTLLLKEGRQIVRMQDAAGNSSYQVLTAKPCHREISNSSREGSTIFQPGDKVKIQYSGLRHPANKLAGIYNMSAYVTYNGVPNGTSLILSANQYTFGSVATAQAVTFDIPADYDAESNPELLMNDGVIQVNGYGDPIGNHRIISHTAGRSPNFTAVAHKTYFGYIPDVTIPVTNVAIKVKFVCNVADADITLYTSNDTIVAKDGVYSCRYGKYSVMAVKQGYRCYRGSIEVAEGVTDELTFNIEMTKAADNAWDGKTLKEPAAVDGVYQISEGAELAWFANDVNSGNYTSSAVLTGNIDLAAFSWSPIGTTGTAKAFKGTFNGNGYAITDLYVNAPSTNYTGLFGYVSAATISNLTVEGEVTGKLYAAGIAGYAYTATSFDRCVSNVTVTASGNYAGGITAYLNSTASKVSTVSNSYNLGDITGGTNCGGIAGYSNATSVVSNVYSLGEVTGTGNVGACLGGTASKSNHTNVFAVKEYIITDGHTLVTMDQMESGEVAYRLGEAFGQKIGTDKYPVIGGEKVLYDESKNSYYNDNATGIENAAASSAVAVDYYDIQGRRINEPKQGINIVRMSDGTVKKIIVK